MNYTKTEQYQDFGDFLATKFYAGEVEPNDWHHGEGYFFGLFGDRRILIDDYGYGATYEKYDTATEAAERMSELHDQRPAFADSDGIVAEDGGHYCVSIEGSDVGRYDDRDAAVFALAVAMVEHGYFPDCFFVYERGGSYRIDDEVNAVHESGAAMRETEATR